MENEVARKKDAMRLQKEERQRKDHAAIPFRPEISKHAQMKKDRKDQHKISMEWVLPPSPVPFICGAV